MMLEGIFLLYCLPLEDNKFRDSLAPLARQGAGAMKISHTGHEIINMGPKACLIAVIRC